MVPDGPLIVQSDHTLLVETAHALYPEVRAGLARFAELVKSPEHLHTYRVTALSLWNAAAAGMTLDDVLAFLDRYSRYPVPQNVRAEIADWLARSGKLKLVADGANFTLVAATPILMEQLVGRKEVAALLAERVDASSARVVEGNRGLLKQALLRAGWPVEDLGGYAEAAPLEMSLRATLRPYQTDAADIFHAGGGPSGGSGVIVLPCGAGKTIVGMAAMSRVRGQTLILCTGTAAARQWRRELLDKTTLTVDQIGEYSGESKQIRPVTLATYQVLIHRRDKTAPFENLDIFRALPWGLLIYDEVHLLPAEVFRMTAHIQSRRRLGLTATLVREDGLETDVFSLIGPKKYDAPWKVLEQQGWIAPASCCEIRVGMPDMLLSRYAGAPDREKFRIASENPAKLNVLTDVLARHSDAQTLVIGQYLDQVDAAARLLQAPKVDGQTRTSERERLFEKFRRGEVRVLVMSRVGSYSLDLPEASVLVQLSGQFGSRQEEAQRLGRVLRPKSDHRSARFYSIISKGTVEQDFALNRQRFLTEQGYAYEIVTDGFVLSPETASFGGMSQC